MLGAGDWGEGLLADRLQNQAPAGAAALRAIDLALEPPFRLGALAVTPSLRELAAPDGARQVLEPRVMQVLVALHRAGGAIVSRDELIRTCWGGTVVGEGSINRTISLLRRASEGIGQGAFRIETLAKVGYRLVLPVVDPASAAADAVPPPRLRARRRPLTWAALGLLVTAIAAAFVLWRPAQESPTYGISVEPFRISGAATSFNEELQSALTWFDVPTGPARVRLALAGLVEERDGVIRVNARLTDPASGTVVWSGALVSPPTPSDPVRAAASLVGQMTDCTLAWANDAGERLPLDVLSEFARTCELSHRAQHPQGVRLARELTHKAPDFPAGWFSLSYHAGSLYLSQPEKDARLRAEALAAAEKLIALRPDAQDGYLEKFMMMDPGAPMAREQVLRRALALEPIHLDLARLYLGDFLASAGRLEEAFAMYRVAQQQMPDFPRAQAAVFLAASATGRQQVAQQALDRLSELAPEAVPAQAWRKAVWAGNWAEAERLMPVEHPAQEQATAAAYRALASGDAAAKQAAAGMVEALPEACCLRLRIELLTQLGHRAGAIALLERFGASGAPGTRAGVQFLWDPALRPLLRDPAIEPFLFRSGWVAYWDEAGVVPDACRENQPPPFCRLLGR